MDRDREKEIEFHREEIKAHEAHIERLKQEDKEQGKWKVAPCPPSKYNDDGRWGSVVVSLQLGTVFYSEKHPIAKVIAEYVAVKVNHALGLESATSLHDASEAMARAARCYERQMEGKL